MLVTGRVAVGRVATQSREAFAWRLVRLVTEPLARMNVRRALYRVDQSWQYVSREGASPNRMPLSARQRWYGTCSLTTCSLPLSGSRVSFVYRQARTCTTPTKMSSGVEEDGDGGRLYREGPVYVSHPRTCQARRSENSHPVERRVNLKR